MRNSQRGWALTSVLFGMSLIFLTMLVAVTIAQDAGKIVNRQLTYQGQASNMAQAGLVEALDWFRRQPAQTAVTTFDSPLGPMLCNNPCTHTPTHSTLLNDTDVETNPPLRRTIQRDVEISQRGNVWGHYEVVSDSPAGAGNPGPAPTGVRDLSLARGLPAAGQVWQVGARGTVYVRNSFTRDVNGVFTVPWNQSPNRRLAERSARREIARLVYNPPAIAAPPSTVNAALYIPNGAQAVAAAAATPRARVVGGAGFAIASQFNSPPAANPPGTIQGSTATVNGLSAGSFTIQNIFGVSQSELFTMADIFVTTPLDLPNNNALNQLPGMQLIVINAGVGATVTFNETSPNRVLRGSGILVVVGNLTVGGASSWNGLIYVNGNYTQTDPATVSGSVILQGTNSPSFNNATASIAGSGDFADLIYDSFIITQMRQQMIGYRFTRPMYFPCPTPNTGDCAP